MKLVVLIILAMTCATLLAENKMMKVAVMDIIDQGKLFDAPSLDAATEYLRSEMVSTGKYIVIDKSRQGEILKQIIREEQKVSYKECYDTSCQIPLGKALSADTLIRSSVSKFAGVYVLTIELVDLAKEAIVKGAKIEFDGSMESFRLAINKGTQILVGNEPVSNQSMVITSEKKMAVSPVKHSAATPEKTVSHPYFWYGVASLGLGAAGLGGGLYFSLSAQGKYDDYTAMTSREAVIKASQQSGFDPQQYQRDVDALKSDGNSYKTTGLISYIAGGIFCAGGIGLMLITEETPVAPAFYFDGKKAMMSLNLKF